MTKRTSIIAALCAVSIASALTAASYATGASDEPTAGKTDARLAAIKAQAEGGHTTAVPIVQSDIAERFPLFRNRPASPIPAELALMIASPTKYGRNPDLARSIETPYGTGWAIPGDGYVCLAVPSPLRGGYGVTCLPPDVAVKQGLWVRFHGDGKVLETLVLPDDTNVVEQSPDGAKAETLTGPADGFVSTFIKSAETTPVLVPTG